MDGWEGGFCGCVGGSGGGEGGRCGCCGDADDVFDACEVDGVDLGAAEEVEEEGAELHVARVSVEEVGGEVNQWTVPGS